MSKRMKRKNEYKKYKRIFEDYLDSGEKITTQGKKKQELIIEDNEEWEQCYSPKSKIRSKLPEYWFVSNKGNVISVSGGKVKWLKADEDSGRYSYHFCMQTDDGTYIKKNIEAHNLVWLVFDGNYYGKAKELLEKYGLFAYGVKNSKELKLNGHHCREKEDNSPENIELVTTEAHTVIDLVPDKNNMDNSEKVNEFLIRFGKLAKTEEPNKISVLATGQMFNKNTSDFIEDNGYRELFAVDELQLSKDAVQQFQEIQTAIINKQIVEVVIENLKTQNEIEYFKEPKYFFVNNDNFYKCELKEQKLITTKCEDITEVADKQLIVCCLNENNNIAYIITEME